MDKNDPNDPVCRIRQMIQDAETLLVSSPVEVYELSHQALCLSRENQYSRGIAESIVFNVWARFQLGDIADVFGLLEEASSIAALLEDTTLKIKVMNIEASCHQIMGKYATSLNLLYKCLSLANKNKIPVRKLVALNNIGEIYRLTGEPVEGMSYLIQALSIANNGYHSIYTPTIYYNIGITYWEMGEPLMAKKYLFQAVELCDQYRNIVTKTRVYALLGAIFLSDKDVEKAKEYQELSLSLSHELKSPTAEVEALIDISTFYLAQENVDKAERLCRQALEICEELKIQFYSYRVSNLMSKILEYQQNYQDSLKYFKLYHRQEKELFSEVMDRKLQHIRALYLVEEAQKESEIYRIKTIELKEVSDRLQKSIDRMASINQLGRKITATLNLEQIAHQVFSVLDTELTIDNFGLGMIDEEKRAIEFPFLIEYGKPLEGITIPIDQDFGFSSYCIQEKRSVLINEASQEYQRYTKNRLQLHGQAMESIIFVPLLIENRVVGLLTVQHHQPFKFNRAQLSYIEALSAYIANAIENSRMHELISTEKANLEQANKTISYLADHDVLTGLPNRRLLAELVERGISLADRRNEKLSVLYVDLDNFKPVNDTLGHEMGDHVLKQVAMRIQESLRTSDFVARIGGDEFAVVLHGIKHDDDVASVASKLLTSLTKPFISNDHKFYIGASIGISIYPQDSRHLDGLLQKADTAMYKVKTGSKGGYVFYHSIENGCST